MEKLCFTAFVIVILSLISFSQASNPTVFVAPMGDGFDTFIAAALINNGVPVTITSAEIDADYIISGQAVSGQNHWYDTVFGDERDRSQGSIKLLKVLDKTIVWAGAAGDRSLWWGALKSGGQKKVANRLARKLKSEYFNGTFRSISKSKTPPTINNNETSAGDSSQINKIETQPDIKRDIDTANLLINSTPSGSDVIIDGKFVGRTPTRIPLKFGDHVIAITKTGYPLWQRTVTLNSGINLDIDAKLERP